MCAAAQSDAAIAITPAAANAGGIAWSMGTLHTAHRTPAGIEAQAISTDISIKYQDSALRIAAAGSFGWQVVAITGATIASGRADNSATIDMPLPGGVYIVAVNTAHAAKTSKIIVR